MVVSFRLHFECKTRNTTSDIEYIELNDTEKLLNHADYHTDLPTMIYGYGYTETYTSLSTQTVVSSFIDRMDHNILVVEWSNYSDGNYIFESIPNAHRVGDLVGKALVNMRDQGFDLEKFYLVGHSLGGHLVGYIGRSVSRHSNGTFKISRITALDPVRNKNSHQCPKSTTNLLQAGPFFTGFAARFTDPLRSDDAIFVDVVHTDSTFFGSSSELGTVDFWPNAGRDQPECPPATPDINSDESTCTFQLQIES